jgi:putative flippase GtrA
MVETPGISNEEKAAAVMRLLCIFIGVDVAAMILLVGVPILVMGPDKIIAGLPLTALPIIVVLVINFVYYHLNLKKIKAA